MKGEVVPWAPQTLVLCLDSVGVYVTHGGCNSVGVGVFHMESLLYVGLIYICIGDQLLVAPMIEHIWGIGVKMEGGYFSKNGLIKSLDLVLVPQEGKVMMRQKAQALKNVVLQAAGP